MIHNIHSASNTTTIVDESRQRPIRPESVHILYGLSGNAPAFLSEFETSLKSVLLNNPINYDLTIHVMADTKAFRALPAVLERTQVKTWRTRNQITIQIYNVNSKIPHWTQWIENKTKLSIREFTMYHPFGMFFRLFVQDIVDPESVHHVIYLDTDVLIMVPLDGLWKHIDPRSYFEWGTSECSGFIVLNVPQLHHVWDLTSTIDLRNISLQLRETPGDQLLFRAINHTYPNVVSILPQEWDVALAHDLWRGSLLKHRPKGIGTMHFNGHSEANTNAFESSAVLSSDKRKHEWGLANYYVRIAWPWVKFIVESTVNLDRGFDVVIVWKNDT